MDKTIIFFILLSLLIRWLISLGPYSGQNQPPMFGDYEAQRHWMEITVNLPLNEWYRNTTDNDLNYWGLDYPPLTAYHSYLMGKMAQYLNPKWIELHQSRGFESYYHKLFMRSTVFISDILIYTSAFMYYSIYQQRNLHQHEYDQYFLNNLFIPGLILIDYGHFQYNSIALGLVFWTFICMSMNKDLIASALFCMAINYKQMSLYYSLPVFFLLLKRCFNQATFIGKLWKFITLSTIVLISMIVIWFPYLNDLNSIIQIISRIFPLKRGIYEDKVANFWYCLSIVIKIKNYFTENQLALFSTAATLLSSAPSCYMLFMHNSMQQFKYSLFTVSMSFYLFSFQVHEKTILFINLAIMLLNYHYPIMVTWFSLIAAFSLLPLLIKDNLVIQYFAVTIIYMAINYNSLVRTYRNSSKILQNLFSSSVILIFILSISSLLIPSPFERYPHLHTLINCLYSFIHFAGFYLYFLHQQWSDYRRTSIKQSNRLRNRYETHHNAGNDMNNLNIYTVIRPRQKVKHN